jgi:hypothetical protein
MFMIKAGGLHHGGEGGARLQYISLGSTNLLHRTGRRPSTDELGCGSTSSLGSGWVSRMRGSMSEISNDGGAGGTAGSILLLSGGWTGIPSRMTGSCSLVASVLRSGLVTR